MENMFGYPDFNEAGEKVLTATDGLYRDMMMNISVFRFQKGEKRIFLKPSEEMALLLLRGKLLLSWDGQSRETNERNDPFEDGASCLHLPCGSPVEVRALADSEFLLQSTENSRKFEARFYGPEDIAVETFGKGLCADTAVREVTTIFDYESAPYSNMVIGEIFNRQGSWSSYIPHSHEQPEVYYYRFDRPQGFGGCFIGENVFQIRDGSFCAIPGGLTHPQVAAPGYRMTYVWMIRHLDGNPWTSREQDPQHTWMTGKSF